MFFALYRDLAGAGEIDLDLPPSATARSAVAQLRSMGGGLARIPAEPVVAVNQEYAALDTALGDGDEMALLPPVAGG